VLWSLGIFVVTKNVGGIRVSCFMVEICLFVVEFGCVGCLGEPL